MGAVEVTVVWLDFSPGAPTTSVQSWSDEAHAPLSAAAWPNNNPAMLLDAWVQSAHGVEHTGKHACLHNRSLLQPRALMLGGPPVQRLMQSNHEESFRHSMHGMRKP